MLIAVDFLPQATFETLTPAADLAAISIGDPGDACPRNLAGFRAALRMEFLDCDGSEPGVPATALVTTQQIAELLTYLKTLHAASTRYRLVVHCRMGVSRSAAVALVAEAVSGCTCPRRDDAHDANRRVVALANALLPHTIEIPGRPAPGTSIYLPPALLI
ncbi:hypothetical protein KTD31_03725 [Burkholderia multivorans]|uniref:hypothetical protein n=1 Tax=Burkholderia multivorans TaxID=87883 RepID=UPI001C23555C|nr:hypothetical protein [Burkholderia multivorans]MBU9200464.1 hypothetical protein [Burkholderia multivorans]MDN8078411.1 hypothetical protein [Burkholderia multivorans]